MVQMEVLDVNEWTKIRDAVKKNFINSTFCANSEWFSTSWRNDKFNSTIQYHARKFTNQSNKYKNASIGSTYLFKTPYMFDKAIRIDFCNYMIKQCNKEKPTFKSKLIRLWKQMFY
jgi:hypothetical protein